MNRIEALVQRYAATESIIKNGAEIVAVADPIGARLNAVVHRLMLTARDDPNTWNDLTRPSRMLRWRLVTHLHKSACWDAAQEVVRQAARLRGAVSAEILLDELTAAAQAAAEAETPLTDTLLHLIGQAGTGSCLLVATSKPAQASLARDWETLNVRVLTGAELAREEACADHAFAIGPPRFFSPSLVTAPTAFSVSFLIPSWVHDRAIPSSVISSYAGSGAIRITAHIRTDGGADESVAFADASEPADDLLPRPVWEEPHTPLREPGSDEVKARKVLLSGAWAIWLDDTDGERIRTVDPAAPAGERVMYTRLTTVQPGTYLLLREGTTEHDALHEIAIGLLGKQAPGIEATQRAWKEKLSRRLDARGFESVTVELRGYGVRAAGRARAWVDPSLIRPHSDSDFRRLLDWLGIPPEPTYGNATKLRRAHHQAGTQIREQLEKAVEGADLAKLEHDGHLSLRTAADGFRTMIATRVLAISPHFEVIARHRARVRFGDEGAQWLE